MFLLAFALTAPQFYPHSVVNAASYAAGAIAPCEIVSIFGASLGPASPATFQLTADRRVSTSLASTRVLFNRVPAPLLYVSATQISAVVPCALAGQSSVDIQIEYDGARSPTVSLPLAAARPGLFTLDSTGQGQAAALHWPDNSINRPSNPARQGAIISLFATAGGWSSPPAEDGRVADQALPLPLPVSATVGGLPAAVHYAGAAPGLVTGVLQVNLRIPLEAPTGDAVPVSLTIAGVSSASGVTLAIRPLTLSSGYSPRAAVFKGQLHCHSTNSDGAQAPAAVVGAYRDAGYHFISLTDHDRVTADPGVAGIVFIPGVEQAPNGNHLNRINVRDVARGSEQAVIDATLAQGGFLFLNHPNWPGGYPANPNWTNAELTAVSGYHGIEVFNATVAPNANAENRADFLLTQGGRLSLLATDDCHNVTNVRCKTASTWVFADSLSAAAIMDGLAAGNSFASNGATFSSISVSARTIAVSTDRASTIDFIADGGRVVQSTRGALAASYTISGDESYVRARLTRASDAAQAWSNPIYLSGPLR